MARVLVDLLFYTGSKGGMESYVERLYSAFPRNTGLEFTGLVSREAEKLDLSWFPGETVPSGVPGENRMRWAAGELLAVPRAARTAGANLIHSPANVGPARSRVPLVLTVHDLLPFVHPEWVPGRRSAAIRWLIRRASRAASRVITVSEASGADIRRVLAVRSERIDVIPLAGRPASTPAIPVGTVPAEEPPLVLLIGNRMPHKNGETLLRALAALPADSRPRLAVTGGSTSGDPLRALAEELGITASVDFVGWVSPAELGDLFERSSVVAVPSRFEGFGLPVLEAMSRGRAVLCSDLPVLREVASDAALYVPADDPAAWARGLRALLDDPSARASLAARGLRRSAGFSWETTADRTAEVFHRVLNSA
jgi:glycosyltransferase involved in cell wall biosynthesis